MTQKDAVLDCLKKMDIDMLNLILDNQYTFQNATKGVFIDKLNSVFKKYQNDGDTEIVLEKGNCTCPNCKRSDLIGYTLIGNISRGYLDLMFKIKDERVIDIYNCKSFYEEDGFYKAHCFECENIKLNKLEYHSIEIARNERAEFIQNEPNLLFINNCEYANYELSNKKNCIININLITTWLLKYELLREQCPYKKGKHTEFQALYDFLKEVIEFLDYIDEAKSAIYDLCFDPVNSKELLIDWLIKYEVLGSDKLMAVSFYFKEDLENNDIMRLFSDSTFSLSKKGFGEIFEFIKVFNLYYWPLLEKLKNDYLNTQNANLETQSLKFYFDRRSL